MTFEQGIEQLKLQLGKLDDTTDSKKIEEVAARLEGLGFTPPVVTPVATFLRLDSVGMMGEIDRILSLPDAEACALAPGDPKKCNDLRLQYITVLLYHYEKLVQLRLGNPDQWDEIDELYVHD